jgi:hypothetical protein
LNFTTWEKVKASSELESLERRDVSDRGSGIQRPIHDEDLTFTYFQLTTTFERT